jgi:hypothetical protein
MKMTIKLILMTMVTARCCSIANAQSLIYSNSFNNGSAVTINGTAPTVANSVLGGSSSATWICTVTNGTSATVFANGNIDTNPGCVLLPFAPQPGCVYFLSASLTEPTGMPNWVAMGFTQTALQTNMATGINVRFTDNPPGGYAWMGIRANTAQGVFAGRGTGSPMGNSTVAPVGTTNFTIVLNTVGSLWTVSAYLGGTISGTSVIGGTQMGTNFTYSANPSIGYVGIGQTSFLGQSVTGIQWNYWSLSVTQVVTSPVTNTCWVAPSALGTGDGSSSANAAGFLNYSFWNNVQTQLLTANVNVNLLDGTYYQGMLGFTNMGNPLHQLTLQAVDRYGADFPGLIGTYLYVLGSQNIKFNGLVFSGNGASYWAAECLPNGLNPCRNLEFSYCQFVNLSNVLYGAIGLVNGTRDVLVDSCTFSNLTANNGNHQHMIYSSHDIVNLVATNCLFQDCLADYVRFRDNSEYCAIENCTFVSTMSASAWPFVSAELYNVTNSDAAGDEFFGNNFQVSGSSFTYDVPGGPGPYAALHFSDTGYSPYTYDCDITQSQANQLNGNGLSFQRAFLQTNMGIITSEIKMFGNTYNSLSYDVDYTYNWDNIQQNGGWSGTVDISGVPDASGASLAPVPVVRNGNFDRQGLLQTPQTSSTPNECLFQSWFCSPSYTTILSRVGFNGTSNALTFNKAANQYVYQWITPPGPTWTMDFLFAMDSGFIGSGVKFRADIFHNDILGSKVSVGVNDQGQVGIFNGGNTFTPLPTLGTISISTNNVYRMRIVGNYTASTPYVNIYTSDANNPALSHQALGLTYWINGAPVSGQSSPETIGFYNFTNTVMLDQVTLASGLGEQPPVISSISPGGGKLIFSGTNCLPGDTYYLLASTNLLLGNWTLQNTNTFNTNGTFSITNTVTPGSPRTFYRLQLQ